MDLITGTRVKGGRGGKATRVSRNRKQDESWGEDSDRNGDEKGWEGVGVEATAEKDGDEEDTEENGQMTV